MGRLRAFAAPKASDSRHHPAPKSTVLQQQWRAVKIQMCVQSTLRAHTYKKVLFSLTALLHTLSTLRSTHMIAPLTFPCAFPALKHNMSQEVTRHSEQCAGCYCIIYVDMNGGHSRKGPVSAQAALGYDCWRVCGEELHIVP